MTSSSTPAGKVLASLEIPFIEFIHPGPISSIEQAAAERNQEINQVVRSILFRCNQGDFFMALVAGKARLNWKNLRQHFQRSRLTTATPDEVLQVTGFEIGTVNPFGLSADIPLLVDDSVLAQPAVSLGSGVYGTAIMITTKNLLKALGQHETGKFS
jgi:Cys-tRNA(Pro)/Cys-tRNA(Cys) deacylase